MSQQNRLGRYSNLLLLVLLSILHLVLQLLNYPSEDWLIEWYAAVDIANGIPLYIQDYKVIDGVWINIPYHFPVFFYMMAGVIVLLGPDQVVGRIFLWLCTNLLFLLFHQVTRPESVSQQRGLILLYFLNPFMLGMSVLGLFDHIAMIFVVAAILAYERQSYLLTGFLIGLGTMTKFYPILLLGVVGLLLLQQQQFLDLLRTILGSCLAIIPIFVYFYSQSGSAFINRTILWQSSRETISMSIWWYISLPQEFLLGLVLGAILMGLVILSYLQSGELPNLFVLLSASTVVFIMILRSLYPQYGFWFTIILIPVLVEFYQSRSSIFWGLLVVDHLVLTVGSICWSLVYASTSTNFIYQLPFISLHLANPDVLFYLGSILANASLVLHLILCLYLLYQPYQPNQPDQSVRSSTA